MNGTATINTLKEKRDNLINNVKGQFNGSSEWESIAENLLLPVVDLFSSIIEVIEKNEKALNNAASAAGTK